ncbi:MAG: hypothetical protein ACRCXX_13470 [Cetobacterium sp.]|uniref:hypothetical protein n=1 Tax=Cetobacterium sp. TaxID=2071632 RepID=UPI003F2A1829
MNLLIRDEISFEVIIGIIKSIEEAGQDNIITWGDYMFPMTYNKLFGILENLSEIGILEKRLNVYCPHCFDSKDKTKSIENLFEKENCSTCGTTFTLTANQIVFCVKNIFWR